MQPRTLKAVSLLLHYPDQDLLDHLTELQAVTNDDSTLHHSRLAALYQHVWVGSVHSAHDFLLALLAFVALMFWKAPPWAVVAACAAVGGLLLPQ